MEKTVIVKGSSPEELLAALNKIFSEPEEKEAENDEVHDEIRALAKTCAKTVDALTEVGFARNEAMRILVAFIRQ